MGVTYKIARNYTLPIAAVVLVLSLVGLVLGWHVIRMADPALDAQLTGFLAGGWDLMLSILAIFGILGGGWYVAEQIYLRRKFERYLDTEKRTEFFDHRKELEDLARRLPERYKPRIAEKDAAFAVSKRR